MSTEEQVREFITQNFLLASEATAIGSDASLLDAGIVDSMGVLELVQFLEETYSFEIADDEIVPGNLDSIDGIVAFIDTKRRQTFATSAEAS